MGVRVTRPSLGRAIASRAIAIERGVGDVIVLDRGIGGENEDTSSP